MHHLVPVVLFLPVIVLLAVLGVQQRGAVKAVAWVGGGYVFWTLTEYWLHRVASTSSPSGESARGCTG